MLDGGTETFQSFLPVQSTCLSSFLRAFCSIFRLRYIYGAAWEDCSSEFRFEDTVVPVTPADCVAKSVYVRDLPFEVSDKSTVSVFSTSGKVYSVKSVYHKEFPAICTGTRTVLMSVNDPVPSVVNAHGFECRVWYPGQPAFCSVCRSSDHLSRACPLSGLCRRCNQPGHVARESVRAWGQRRPPAPVASDPGVSSEEEDLSSVSSEVAKPTLPVPSTTVSAPVSFVTAVSAPVSSVLPVSSSVPSLSPLSIPVPSVSANVPVSSCSATSRDENVSMSPEPSVVGSPRTVSSADYKKLIRLVVPKVKLGSDFSTVKKQCLSLAKSHKLNVSAEECARIASSVCSGDDPPSLPDIFPEDYVLQVRSTLDK